MKHKKTTKAAPEVRRMRSGACQLRGIVRGVTWLRVNSLLFGVTSRTIKRTMKGRLAGKPISHGTLTTYFVASAPATPRSSPPTYVNGRFEKYPIAAAPKACTTRSVSTNAVRFRFGAISKPQSAANEDPIIHASRRTRVALLPCTERRSGSSTTARSSMPRRVNLRKAYRPHVVASAIIAVMICSHSTLTDAILTVFVERNEGKFPLTEL